LAPTGVENRSGAEPAGAWWTAGTFVSLTKFATFCAGSPSNDGRVVTIGQLVLFFTESGDAWLLDPSDQLAARLARDEDPEPFHIEENETTFTIDWKGSYRVKGAASFTGIEKPDGSPPSIDIRRTK
jgi:hypothetical protein